MMKNYDSRIARLEETLTPKRKTILIINYLSETEDSWLEFAGNKIIIPQGVDVQKFISEKTKQVKGVIACTVYLSNISQESVSDLTGSLSKDDVLMTIKGYGDDISGKAKR